MLYQNLSNSIIFNLKKPNIEIGRSYQNLGNIYSSLGDHEKALRNYFLSVSNWQNVFGKTHPYLAGVYNQIAEHYLYKNPNKALEYVNYSLSSNSLTDIDFAHYTNINLENFLSLEITLTALRIQAKVYVELAKSDSSNFKKALLSYQAASDMLDQMRRLYSTDGSKYLLAEKGSEIYEEAIEVALALFRHTKRPEYVNRAFFFAEKGKAAVLIDAMLESNARQYAGIPDSLLEREKDQRILLAHYERSLKSEKAKGEASDTEKIARWEESTFALKSKHEALIKKLEDEFPEYYQLKYTNFVALPDDVRNQILTDDDVLIEYVLGNDSLYVFTITEDKTNVTAIQNDSTLQGDITRYREGIIERSRSDFMPASYAVYQKLIEPVSHIISKKRNWIIIPDGILNTIPFEALISSEANVKADYYTLPFVIRDHSIRYTYSSTLELNQRRRKDFRSKSKEDTRLSIKKDFLAFAPVFKEGISRKSRGGQVLGSIRSDTSGTKTWGYLPKSEDEVTSIESLFRKRYGLWGRFFGDNATTYLHKKASEATLKSSNLYAHRYLHFATHGIINENVPELSGIVLSADTSGGQDGVLHLGEIYNLELDADLVVLSACQTGTGKVIKGEGLMGLTRGFMYAGADALLASLWPVEDTSTSVIMKSFYADKLSGSSTAEAIRSAKLSMIGKDPVWSSPFYWAGFILVGE